MGDAYTIEDSVPLSPEESPQKTKKKLLTKDEKIDKEKKELLSSLAAADFSSLKPRVASVLNLYPHTRNSDISLSLKYWEIFQRDIYNESGILPKDLFKLERLHYIVRARAKIQNEYGLFLADSEIKKSRRKNEEKMEGAVLEDSAPRKTVHIFSDETGRRQKLSATPDLSGTVLPLCLIPNSALKNAPPFKSAVPKGSACARLLA